MAGPINPITLSMIGAVGGAALKPNNPLQGALLGATAGYTGGTALGIGAPAAATGTAVGDAALASQVASQPAMSYAGGNIANAATSNLSFMDKLGMAGKSAYENPMMTSQALGATTSLLSPEQSQMPSAPAMPLQAGRGVKPYDPMASMDPYKQSVVGGQPISLI